MTLDQWIELTKNLTLTGFLLVCVFVLTYALYHMYLDSRLDWSQIQKNTQDIALLNQTVTSLITKIDQLITELHASNHSAQPTPPVKN